MYAEYNKKQRDPAINARYNNDEWPIIRNEMLTAYPFCQRCRHFGRLVKSEHVHHIKPLAEGGSNDPSNLICLCHRCHSQVHAERGDYFKKNKVYTY